MLVKKTIRPLALLAALALVVVVAAACGGNNNSTTATGAASAPAATPPATTATTPPATQTTATTPPPATRSTAARPPPAAAGAPSAAQVSRGRTLFTSDGCTACHSISGQTGIGPPLNGLAGSRVPLTTGQTVVADNAYLTRSIDNPDAQIVRGFQRGIMSATIRPGSINATDTASLVAYITSLR